MTAYYNEIDKDKAAWIRELIKEGVITDGEVDERDIRDIDARDFVGFDRIHLFAGVGTWDYALTRAGYYGGTVWTISCPCFPAGTLILTERGQIPIEHVRVGDIVLTHEKRWKKVTETMNSLQPTIMVKGQGHFGLETTSGHPFYARRGRRNHVRTSSTYSQTLWSDPEWIEAKDMGGKQWSTIAFVPEMSVPIPPLPVMEKHRAQLNLPSSWTSSEFAFFLGYWVGDGWTRESKSVVLCGGHEDSDLIHTITTNAGLFGSLSKERTGVRVRIGSIVLASWLRRQFGQGAAHKTIPAWLHGQPPAFREAFIEGWMRADGSKEKAAKGKDAFIRSVTTVSRSLAIGLRILLNQSGRSASILYRIRQRDCYIEGRKVNEKPTYKVVEYESARSFQFHSGFGWGTVRSVKPTGRTETVYNLEVEDDHSYAADGIVVHNCPPFSVAGKEKECPQCGAKGSRNLIAHPGRTGFFVCCVCSNEWLADERHLWPEVWRLQRDGRPAVCFGEQVWSDGGKTWFSAVRASMEILGYACRGYGLCSPAVGSSDIRRRLYFGADRLADAGRRRVRNVGCEYADTKEEIAGEIQEQWLRDDVGNDQSAFRMVHPELRRPTEQKSGSESRLTGGTDQMANPGRNGRRGRRDGDSARDGGEIQIEGRGSFSGLVDTNSKRGRGRTVRGEDAGDARLAGQGATLSDFWPDTVWIPCDDPDGPKLRPVQAIPESIYEQILNAAPGDIRSLRSAGCSEKEIEFIERLWKETGQTLAELLGIVRVVCMDGTTRSVVWPLIENGLQRRLRISGFGDAINGELATEFIRSYLECER
jgi:site-specific DNA-cytosine methylase